MGLEKSIEKGTEHRKPYYGAKAVDCSCRNNGTCPYCLANRMRRTNREKQRTDMALREYEENTK